MEQRMAFALKALRTDNFRVLCAAYGISAKTGYKWRERLLRRGLEGMAEAARRPHHHPDQLSPEVVCEMVRLKQLHPYWGPRKIRALYQRMHGQAASESSFKRMLARAGRPAPRPSPPPWPLSPLKTPSIGSLRAAMFLWFKTS
jgi:transposase